MAVGFEAHYVVELVEEGGASGFGAVGFAGGLGGAGGMSFDGGVAVFLEVEGFFADAREDGEEPQVHVGIGLGIGDGEFGEEFAHADGGELEAEFLEFVGVSVAGQVEGEVEFASEEVEVFLVAEPILVAAGVPVGDVAFGDRVRERRVGGLVELLNDLGVGDAVGEEIVYEVAEFFGEAGDFAVATRCVGGLGQGGRRWRGGWRWSRKSNMNLERRTLNSGRIEARGWQRVRCVGDRGL